MKTFKIDVPKGYVIDSFDKSTGEVTFKKLEYPATILDLHSCKNRFYIDPTCGISKFPKSDKILQTDRNLLSSEKRAEAFLALMQLVEYRDAWNEIDGFEADWSGNIVNHLITVIDGNVRADWGRSVNFVLYFGSVETRDLFLETFKDLIETAKELL